MAGHIPERRRSPRAPLPASAECRLHVRTRVRLLDISLTGVLLACDFDLPPGTTAQLRSAVAAVTFAPTVQVKRVADPSGRGADSACGAMFTAMDDRSKRTLEEFLKKASS
jgi:hypothetical protein